MKALMALETAIKSSLEPGLIELVKTRASQINGCAYCLQMHTRDARAHGETEERLYLLSAWEESPLYTERERAALAWTDAVTLVAQTHVPDNVFETLRKQFSDEEIAKLTLLVGTINLWNRMAISFRAVHRRRGLGVSCQWGACGETAAAENRSLPPHLRVARHRLSDLSFFGLR
jgi:AhpD family alkylhydroperoxidase